MVSEMYVVKRNGNKEIVSFDKILNRIRKAGEEVGIQINYTTLVIKVIDQLYDGISSTKIDELLGEQCASMSSIHPDYNVLAGRITVSNHHKNTSSSFSDVVDKLYNHIDKHDKQSPLVSKELHDIVSADPAKYDALCDYNRDYLIDYFGFKTLERSYLMSINKVTVERPQHMWLRVSLGIHGDVYDKVVETYEHMSKKYFTHATPTLFNAGTPSPQLSSCYLLAMEEDSIDGIFNTLKDCARISKWAGGIGLHIHNVRASGSHINGTNGSSNGIVPMLRVFNNTAKYVDQCLHPTTAIYTTQGPIMISEVVPGITAVFNRTGGTEIVDKVLEHSYSGNVVSISLEDVSNKPIMVTPEHPFYAVTRRSVDNETLVKDLDVGLVKMEWIDAAKLDPNTDLIVYPIPNYTVDNPALTEDICYIYGIILSGMKKYYSHTLKLDYMKEVILYQTEENIKLLADFFDRKFVKYRVEDFAFSFEANTNLPFVMSDFYNKTYLNNLGIGKRWYFLPKNKIQRILDGIDDEYKNIDVQFLKFRAGINTEKCVRYKDYLLVPIKSMKTLNYNGILYDLQMKTEHNYLIEGGLVHNGGGKRNGSFAIYLEPWHADIEMFLQMRKNHGDEELKARDLFYALWIPDLFMDRVKSDGEWSLMCPDECPGLSDVWGPKFVELYQKYEQSGKARKKIKARELWFQIMDSQMETGTPYLLYKDACNKKSNQQNLGTIKSSNLCVAPETQILTDNGHVEIRSVVGQEVNVWNGQEFSGVTVFKTGENQELIDVYTSDGCKLTCTKYHKFFIGSTAQLVEAKDLNIGDAIIKCEYPIIDGVDTGNTTVDLTQVPATNVSMREKMEWFSLYCDVDAVNINGRYFRFFSTNWPLLMNVKMMLQTCGINPFLQKMYDTTPEQSHTYDPSLNAYMNDLYNMEITANDLHKLTKFGFSPKITSIPVDDVETAAVTILSIVDNGRKDDTYCFTEPKRSAGIFNGVLTSQCTEIIEYSDSNETAVCNLASIALPSFVECTPNHTTFIDYEKLHAVTKIVTYNLNRIIDVNFYPTDKTRVSNMKHRPIGIGVQGLADLFMMMNVAFKSETAKDINKKIFETIYHAALEQSCEMAQKEGHYETFAGSPASRGVLQFDMWGLSPDAQGSRYDWYLLKERIRQYGLRNSLLLAPMPTASTSQILGFNECIEPITSNIYTRRTLAGEFILANKYLMNDLIRLGLWDERVKNSIIANNGSIQHIDIIPEEIREKYRTVWEIPMKHLIDMAADRGIYICQSQSLNLWIEDPNYSTLTSMHFYSWSKGLKTGIYYLRRRGKHQAQQFTIEPEKKQSTEGQLYDETEDEICEMCSA